MWKFLAIISSNIFVPFSFSFPSENPITYVLGIFIFVTQVPEALPIYFFLFSILNLLFFRNKISTDLSLGSLTPSSVTPDISPLSEFLFQIYFQS